MQFKGIDMEISNTQTLRKTLQLDKKEAIDKITTEKNKPENTKFSVLQDDVVTLSSGGGGHPTRPKKQV